MRAQQLGTFPDLIENVTFSFLNHLISYLPIALAWLSLLADHVVEDADTLLVIGSGGDGSIPELNSGSLNLIGIFCDRH